MNADPAARLRILIVDDSSLVRLYYRDALEKGGFATEQATAADRPGCESAQPEEEETPDGRADHDHPRTANVATTTKPLSAR